MNFLKLVLIFTGVVIVMNDSIAKGMLSFDIEKARLDRENSSFWNGDRARFLDNKEVFGALAKVNNKPNTSTSENTKKTSNEQVVNDLYVLFTSELATKKGVHIETLLTAIGSVAGFSVQMGLREDLVKTGKLSAEKAFTEVKTNDGETYYFGDLINQGLLQPPKGAFSVWTIVAGAPHHLGKPVPDINSIVKRTTELLGSPDALRPDLEAKHMPHKMPDELVWKFWNISRNTIIANSRNHMDMPFIMALLAQRVILEGKDHIDPTLAAKIVMSAAVPMSKIDPKYVEYSYFKSYE